MLTRNNTTIKLNVFIAKAGVCSRRKADILIKEGRVKINGCITVEPWTDVGSKDFVAVDGKPLRAEFQAYIIVNKPRGMTVTLEDRHAKLKISDIIPKRYGRIFPVGRLDKDTTGLIILTNDGELCHALTHPSFEVEQEYVAAVEGAVDQASIGRMKAGVIDDGDLLKVKSVSMLSRNRKKTVLKIVISEGKKRHIRRLLKQVGAKVLNLKRVRIGNLELGALKEGKFKVLDKREVYHLALGK
jgi:23S rRNA pseudouridine2605 synthase